MKWFVIGAVGFLIWGHFAAKRHPQSQEEAIKKVDREGKFFAEPWAPPLTVRGVIHDLIFGAVVVGGPLWLLFGSGWVF